MNKIFFTVAFIATALVQTSFAQDKTSDIFAQYYAIKDALVSGNASLANTKAIAFVKTVADDSALPEANRSAVLKDAAKIAATKDLKKQREYFSAFSEQMFVLAKSTKLNTAPVYKAYCPMAKGSWLSSSSAIKNPYYGSAMLTCGKVVETIK
ncbi:MAG: DUF3347 domain-containing protein [Daejeonella sp.]